MKKIFAILLLTFLIINSIGFIAFYYYNSNLIKNEIKALFLKNPVLDKLELISIEKSQLKNPSIFRRVNDKEIRYKGKLYDVFKEIVSTDKILFYGINDKKEEELFSNLSNYYKGQFNSNNIFKDKIRNFNQLFFFGFIDKVSSIDKLDIQNSIFLHLPTFYKSIVIDIISPPPKFS